MKEYVLKRDNGKDVRFTGKMLAEADSRDFKSRSRGHDRWTEMAMYKTEGGSFIVSITGRSNMPGEVDRLKVDVFKNKEDMFDKVGFSYLSKALYDEAQLIQEEFIK